MGAEDKPGSKHDAAAERRERTQAVSSPQQKNRIRDLKIDPRKNFRLSIGLYPKTVVYIDMLCMLPVQENESWEEPKDFNIL